MAHGATFLEQNPPLVRPIRQQSTASRDQAFCEEQHQETYKSLKDKNKKSPPAFCTPKQHSLWSSSTVATLGQTGELSNGGPLFHKYRQAKKKGIASGWAHWQHTGYTGSRGSRYPYNNRKDLERLCAAIALVATEGACTSCIEREIWTKRHDNTCRECTIPWVDSDHPCPPSKGMKCPYCNQHKDHCYCGIPPFEPCPSCLADHREDHFKKRYVVAGGNSIFRGRGGYTWEEEEYYCLEHWARWLRWGLASQVDCEQWVEWADGVLDALVASWREKVAEKNTMCR